MATEARRMTTFTVVQASAAHATAPAIMPRVEAPVSAPAATAHGPKRRQTPAVLAAEIFAGFMAVATGAAIALQGTGHSLRNLTYDYVGNVYSNYAKGVTQPGAATTLPDGMTMQFNGLTNGNSGSDQFILNAQHPVTNAVITGDNGMGVAHAVGNQLQFAMPKGSTIQYDVGGGHYSTTLQSMPNPFDHTDPIQFHSVGYQVSDWLNVNIGGHTVSVAIITGVVTAASVALAIFLRRQHSKAAKQPVTS